MVGLRRPELVHRHRYLTGQDRTGHARHKLQETNTDRFAHRSEPNWPAAANAIQAC